MIFDQAPPPVAFTDPRVEVVVGDISAPGVLAGVLGPDVDTVFHLAGVVSGGGR